ncbi:MAG: ATP-binding protein [Gammaproteobacteria bacterium]
MRNLFFKVFALILFSAVALFAAAAGFFYFAHDHGEFFEHDYEDTYELAHDAVAAWREGGRAGLARKMRAVRRHGMRAFLMHENGRAIGRRLPRGMRARITHYPQTIAAAKSRRGTFALRAVSVRVDGRTYRFVLAARHGARAPFFGGARMLLPLPVIALASLLISLLITRPLGGLKSAAQRFASGNLAARAPPKITRRNDAFGELAREFDRMSARIEKLVGGHRRLLRDVSHELRSPLSRMQVAATLLENKAGESAEVARIQSEIRRLDALISQLLSLTKLQDGALTLTASEFDLADLLRRVARDAAYEFAGQGKRIEVHGDALPLRADAGNLRSAFENVIRNALRYARATVEVRIARETGAAVIRIRDDGPGVPAAELRNIFDAFHRPDPSRSAASGGAGIGLAIAKGVVEAHHGRIKAANAAGGGLVVSVRLPCS